MDYECLQEAADRMMIDVMQALTAIKPDILIEFRQHYIGPCMRQFGNMFRVSDCPADIAANRIGMMDLRMLSGSTAVHSDMITWHDDDRPEDAALQILNTIFGVTQFSKIIGKLRPDQKKMTVFWLRFERENQRVLQESKLIPSEPQFLYPVITACDEQEEIIAVYADSKVISPDFSKRKTQLVNACWQPFLTVRVPEETKAAVQIFDCMGNAADGTMRVFPAGIQEIAVPRSGLAVIMPIQK
jgi:alpha-galactosidase